MLIIYKNDILQTPLTYYAFIGSLDGNDYDDEKDETLTDGSLSASLAHVHSYLSTIAEGNSPYCTEYGGLRSSTEYPPTAASIFDVVHNHLVQNSQHDSISEMNQSPSTISRYSNPQRPQSPNSGCIPTSDSEYYPLASEVSERAISPRFTIEEVASANYEPILVTSAQGIYTSQ